MAIAFGSLLGQVDSATDAASYVTGSFVPEANALLIAAIGWSRASLGNDPTFSGGSLTWSALQDRVGFNTVASPTDWIGWAWAIAPASPSSMTVTADFAGQNQLGCSLHVFSLTGAHATAPRVQVAPSSTDNNGAISATLGTTPTSSVIAVVGSETNVAIDPREFFTEISDAGHGTPAARLETQYRLVPSNGIGSGSAVSGTPDMAIIVVEIAVADAATGQPATKRMGAVPGGRQIAPAGGASAW